MKVFTEIVHYAWALMGGFVGWFLGGFDGFLYALLVFVIIDYLTGVMVAVLEKKVSSSVGFIGIFKKILIFCLVAIGHIIDTQVIQNGSILRTAVIFFYISNEGVSLLENAGHLGLPIPERVKTVLEQLHDRAEKIETEEK